MRRITRPCEADVWRKEVPPSSLGDDPDPKVRDLKARLARITQAAEARDWWRNASRALLPFAVAFCVTAWGAVGVVMLSPWPAGLTGLHLVSALGCDVTWAVGLAPATRGQPGYWPWHDGDKDGIACEPRRRHIRYAHRYEE